MEKEIRKKIVLVLVVLNLISIYRAATLVTGKNLTYIEIRKELKRLNKPAIKSIKSEDGDIIDCVDIYKQPAFDHPLLKNHTIQMRPSFYDSKKVSSSELIEQLWHKSGSCPEGTIPIRRTRKGDLVRAISSEGLKEPLPTDAEYAKMEMQGENHGAEASISVWKVHVEPSEYTAASIYVCQKETMDFVNAGWMISPKLLGDDNTRIYARWVGDKGVGCYNLKCPGFVQLSNKISLGAAITPLSTYGGQPYWISERISMDPENGHWWLVIQDESVGYWPAALFRLMIKSANLIQWAGEVLSTASGQEHTSTQMGSGHFSKEGYKKAAFFDNCVYLINHDETRKPINPSVVAAYPNCYDISEPSKGRDRGLWFYYGGPGGPNCDL